jgi:hypothetical protein
LISKFTKVPINKLETPWRLWIEIILPVIIENKLLSEIEKTYTKTENIEAYLEEVKLMCFQAFVKNQKQGNEAWQCLMELQARGTD